MPLNPDIDGSTWKFADILAKATALFGSQQEAEQWLERPAIGLNRHKPSNVYHLDGLIARVRKMEPEFSEERRKKAEERHRVETPKGLRGA